MKIRNEAKKKCDVNEIDYDQKKRLIIGGSLLSTLSFSITLIKGKAAWR